MDNGKVSIIVPVYNVEKYLPACVESLRTQTYGNLEILLVDDGSKDHSPRICDEFARTDPRIRVIHKTNGGAASARNVGIDAARGAYICFVDSDDVVEKEYVSHLVQTAEKADADAATCGFCLWTKKQSEVCAVETAPGVYDCEAFMQRFLQDWSCSLLWNKIFRREAVGEIRMEEGHRVDDEFFTYRVCMCCERVAVTDRMLYRYRIRKSSVMQDMFQVQEKTMLDRIAYVTARYAHIRESMPGLEQAYFLDAVDTLARYWHHSKEMPQAQRRIRQWVRKHTWRLIGMNLPVKQKIGYLLRLYLIPPAVTAEANSLQTPPSECFD